MPSSRSATPRRSTRSQSRDPEGLETSASTSALLSPIDKQAVRRKARTPKSKKVVEAVVEEELDDHELHNVMARELGPGLDNAKAIDMVTPSLKAPEPIVEIQKPSKGKIRLKKIVRRLAGVVPYLPLICILSAILLFLAIPTPEKPFKRKVYVDENALQPGGASVEWNWGEVEYADALAERIRGVSQSSAEARAALISQEIRAIGMKAYNQSYSFVTPMQQESRGINTYARWSAARGDGRETFVIAAAWKSAWDGTNDPDTSRNARSGDEAPFSASPMYVRKMRRRANVRGIATALTIARHLVTYGHWSKDLLFVIADDELEGMQAWASKYFGREQSNLQAEDLHGRGSQVWNALAIDYPSDSFSHIVLKQEGLDGQLPNLDVISTLIHLMHRAGSVPIELAASSVDRWPHRPLGQFGDLVEQYVFRGGDGARRYLSGLWNMLYQFGILSSGRPSGIHGLLHRYHVDAITIFAYPAQGPYGFWQIGRAVEAFTRSMSNLLERLHHSHFFYVLTSPEHFVEVAKYLPIAILFALALLVQAIRIWYEEGVRGAERQEKLIQLIRAAIEEEAEAQDSTAFKPTFDVTLASLTIAQRTAEVVSLVVARASQTDTLIGSTKVRSIARLLDSYGRPYGTAMTTLLFSHAIGVLAFMGASNTAVDCAFEGVERCRSGLQISALLFVGTALVPVVITRSSSEYFYDQLEAVQTLLPESALVSAFRLSRFRGRSVARVSAALAMVEGALVVFVLSLVNFSLAAVLGLVLSTAFLFCRLPPAEETVYEVRQQTRIRSGTPASDDSTAVEQEIVSEGRTARVGKAGRIYWVIQSIAYLLLTPTYAIVLLKVAHQLALRFAQAQLPTFAVDLSLVDRMTDAAVWNYQILSSTLLPILFLAYVPIISTAAIASLLVAYSR